MIARAGRLLLASGFLAAVAHVAPVAERAALGITRLDADAHRALAEVYLFATRGKDLPVRALGRLTVDTEGGNHAE